MSFCSQPFPLTPSLWQPLYCFLSLQFCFCNNVINGIIQNHTVSNLLCLVPFTQPTALGITSIVSCMNNLFQFIAEQYSINVRMDHGQFIHSMHEEHLNCFQSFAWMTLDLHSTQENVGVPVVLHFYHWLELSVYYFFPFILAILIDVWRWLILVLICICLMTNDAEHFFISLFVIHITALVQFLFIYFTHFKKCALFSY